MAPHMLLFFLFDESGRRYNFSNGIYNKISVFLSVCGALVCGCAQTKFKAFSHDCLSADKGISITNIKLRRKFFVGAYSLFHSIFADNTILPLMYFSKTPSLTVTYISYFIILLQSIDILIEYLSPSY